MTDAFASSMFFSIFVVCVTAYLVLSRWRSWWCKHEWENLGKVNRVDSERDKIPTTIQQTFRCKACGSSRKYDL
jgi:hypothetical protein